MDMSKKHFYTATIICRIEAHNKSEADRKVSDAIRTLREGSRDFVSNANFYNVEEIAESPHYSGIEYEKHPYIPTLGPEETEKCKYCPLDPTNEVHTTSDPTLP